jgi:glycosyltransferase involved in cell wall biosynthesis
MKRILFITTNRLVTWGGSEILWIMTAHNFLKEGYEVGFVMLKSRNIHPQIQSLIDAGAKPFYITEWKTPFNFLKRKIDAFRNYYAGLDSFKPDMVLISLSNHAKTNAWPTRCQARKIKYALIFQQVAEHFVIKEPSYRNEVLAATKLFFVSKQNKDIVSRLLYDDLKNSAVIFNEFQVSLHTEFTWPQLPEYTLALVSRIDTLHKGIDILFEALNQDKWRQRKFKINIYGEGPNKEYLIHLKGYFKLDLIEFKGHVNNVADIWKNNHGFVLASRQEGMSLALIESMICGRVPIVTDVGGAREIIQDNVNGFIALATHPELLDDALERAWHQRERWNEIGLNAYTHIRSLIREEPSKTLVKEILKLGK